ncbi:MAG: hypothetical protein ABI151_04815 [Chitinophagaceae bacterium]
MKKFSPFVIGSIFLLAIVAILEYITLKKTNHVFCYPLDDTFIHLAVAKNAALHGNWGVSANEWVSTSSSPLFTGLLTMMIRLFGVKDYLPLLLALFGSFIIIGAMQTELNRYTSLSVVQKSAIIIITLFVGAIPSLSALGMEHTFQIAFSLLFVHAAANVLANPQTRSSQIWIAALWGALMTFTRYENSFIVVSVCGLLLLRKRFGAMIIIGAASAAPLVLFGLYAVSHGGFFIPNSIQIKVRDNYKQLLNGGLAMLEVAASISGLIVIALFILLDKLRKKEIDRTVYILGIFVISGLLHSVFGGFGWFYRYEAYLIVLGAFHLLILFFEWFKNRKPGTDRIYLLIGAIALLLTFNLPLRGMNALRNYIRSTYNIYEQQYQMGLFVKEYYDGKAIAANDIGAISYLADVQMIDLWGLGSNEVTRARKGHYWNDAFLDTLVHKKNASIAIIYDSWFTEDLYKNWQKAGTWEVSYSFMLGDTKVSFYAIDPAEADKLRANLKAFSKKLPADIVVKEY